MSFLLAALLAGCAMPSPRFANDIDALRAGLGAAHEQTEHAFEAVNQDARRIDIERVATGPAANLVENEFPLALARDDIAAWSYAFSSLDAYLAAVSRLVDPKRSASTADALDGLAKELREGVAGAKLPGALTAAFSTFAEALVQARAEHTALGIMQRTDAAFNGVTTAMADAIGPDDRSGIRQTERLYWAGKLADMRGVYAPLTGAGSAALDRRRALAQQFAAAVDARDAQLRDLGALRTSLLALGQAHAAAARGDGGNARFWIGRIGGWLDEMKHRAAAAEKAA